MKVVVLTWWDVSAESYADDFGCEVGDAYWQVEQYVSAAAQEIPELLDVDGYVFGLPSPPQGPMQLDGRVRFALHQRVEVDRERWAGARQLDPRGPVRGDLAEYVIRFWYHLGGIAETDAVMRAQYRDGRGGIVAKTLRPEDRHRR
ncbi:hypothetical protein SMD44_p10216 (plasmid) [Streptomyces alboflavus]|uniref:Uncharacterized protein n=1 Tax=Streptomyces alboflavus TaxID=67267 RepID=A0A291W3K9_9ACTN|nr:hypothetical protein [Streptomyces alboflavus]ATM24715.1 hypothetical protein SMD44_p10216 [Streptomyces alboflavus]